MSRLLGLAFWIGVIDAIIFKLFEALVNNGSNWIWNDVFHSDTTRWLVVPLAVVLSIALSRLMQTSKTPRWVKPETDLFAQQPEKKRTTLGGIGLILLNGGASLLAGASLGPEMALTDSSKAIGKFAAEQGKAGQAGAVLVAASIGALMVAFLGSLLMVTLPLLLVYKQAKKLTLESVLPIVLAAVSAYATLWVMDPQTKGYGSIPAAPHVDLQDYIAAAVVALCASIFAFCLVQLIKHLSDWTQHINQKWPWYASAGLFGLVLGIIYLVGGQSVQFSGSAGSSMLLHNAHDYGTWAFLGLAVVKLLATGWSKTTGYRGGLFFPSIYAGLALSLFVGSLDSPLAGAGALVGAIAGIFAAVSDSGIVAFLMIVAILPYKLIGVAVVAIAAALAGNKLLNKLPTVMHRNKSVNA
ncbi:MAG TPA: chloride channel protein [Candidatus Saccharimonadia bacterium]|nr:chloride channel protein [Candidatus Saccharimonadia bacterium]